MATIDELADELDKLTLLDAAKKQDNTDDANLSADRLREMVATFKQVVLDQTGHEFPQEPREQLRLAIQAVFHSWNTERAAVYRRQEHIPDDLGTAVNVVVC